MVAGWKFDEAGNLIAAGEIELSPVSAEGAFAQFREDANTPDPSRDPDYADHLQRVVKALEEAGQ